MGQGIVIGVNRIDGFIRNRDILQESGINEPDPAYNIYFILDIDNLFLHQIDHPALVRRSRIGTILCCILFPIIGWIICLTNACMGDKIKCTVCHSQLQ